MSDNCIDDDDNEILIIDECKEIKEITHSFEYVADADDEIFIVDECKEIKKIIHSFEYVADADDEIFIVDDSTHIFDTNKPPIKQGKEIELNHIANVKQNGIIWVDKVLKSSLTLTKPGSISYLLYGGFFGHHQCFLG